MAHQASSKYSTNLGFEGNNGGQASEGRKTNKGSLQGQRGSVHQFYTPSCVVRCLVEMLAQFTGRIYDTGCGSGGSLPAGRLYRVRLAETKRAFAQGFEWSEQFVESHGGYINCYDGNPKEAMDRFNGTVRISLKLT